MGLYQMMAAIKTLVFSTVLACSLAGCLGSDLGGIVDGLPNVDPGASAGGNNSSGLLPPPPASGVTPPVNNGSGGNNAPFVDPSPEPAEVGPERQYAQLCAGCHALDGKGVAERGTEPIGPGACSIANCFDVPSLSQYIENNMPRTGPVACMGQCAQDLAAYVINTFTNNAPPIAPPPAFGPPEPQTPAQGRQSYLQYCASCHGNTGQGGAGFGGSIRPGSCMRTDCTNIDFLYNYLSIAMPPPPDNPSACVRECALGVATYMVAGFQVARTNEEGVLAADDLRNIVEELIQTSRIKVFSQESGDQLYQREPLIRVH